jgi:ubiquinone/menaquinone biosynthesis C-methylase UbiE
VDSVSFDSIASIYDATRVFDEGCFNTALDYIAERFPPSKYKRLFEPGIGTGRIAIPLAEKGYSVTGVDISRKMLKILAGKLSRRHPPLPVTFQQGDITVLPFPDATFDIAVAVHVFHLIREWKKAMDEVFRVIQPDAPLVLLFTGSGYEVPHIKDRYRALSAEYGYSTRHIGMINSDTDLPDYVTSLGRHIERINNNWKWQQHVRIDKAFNNLKAGFYSSSKLVPDDIHNKVIDRLEIELKQQYGNLAVEVEVPTQIAMILVLPG